MGDIVVALAGLKPVAVGIGLLELVVEAEPVVGVDGLDAERQKQLEKGAASKRVPEPRKDERCWRYGNGRPSRG